MLKEGDKVIVLFREEGWKAEMPYFTDEMRKYSGTEQEVELVCCERVLLRGINDVWREDWLHKISSKKQPFCVRPEKIVYNGPATIVFWADGDKTVVKAAPDEQYDEYDGFTAALAKKIYGSTSAVKKLIKDKKNGTAREELRK